MLLANHFAVDMAKELGREFVQYLAPLAAADPGNAAAMGAAGWGLAPASSPRRTACRSSCMPPSPQRWPVNAAGRTTIAWGRGSLKKMLSAPSMVCT